MKKSPIGVSASIRNCAFKFKCAKQWEELEVLAAKNKRFCKACKHEVHWVDTDEKLLAALKKNWCVAIPHEKLYGDEILVEITVGIV